MAANVWLNLPASSNLLFVVESDDIWNKAYATLGVDPAHYVADAGTA
jgi:putative AlgH/UPF0301 family transcriptional regulator